MRINSLNRSSTLLLASVCLIILGLLSVLFYHNSRPSLPPQPEHKKTVVAITQIVEHRALDEERSGIIKALEKGGYVEGKNLEIVYQNAQGNITTAAQIATQLVSYRPDIVIAISTPSAQTLVSPLSKAGIPLVFTAVTDPKDAKIITDFAERKEPVTGVMDKIAMAPQLALIQRLVPTVKNIGVIYNPGEANSVNSVKELEIEAKKLGLTIVQAMASRTSEVSAATAGLMGKVEAIFIPNDNTAVSAIESIQVAAHQQGVPVFAADTGSIERGAVAGYVYDRFMLGEKAGEIAVRILKGESASHIPIAQEHLLKLAVNMKSAEKLGLKIPADLMSQAQIMGGGASVPASKPAPKKAVIALTQIIEHPALDQEREGFLQALKEAGYIEGKNLEFIYQSAQGNIATATQIASQFVSQHPDVAVAISTPSAQTMKIPMEKAGIPLVFSAVTDPKGAKIVSNMDKRPELVTGVSDRIPLAPLLHLILKIIPQAKRIGVIYNPGELNSLEILKELELEAKKLDLTIVPAPASRTSEVAAAVGGLVGKIDALFVPNDNTAGAAIDSILSVTNSHKIPAFATDVGGVAHGCVAGYVYDRQELGKKAGQLVIEILNGKRAGDIPIVQVHPLKIQVNKTAAAKIGLEIPPDLLKDAEIVGE